MKKQLLTAFMLLFSCACMAGGPFKSINDQGEGIKFGPKVGVNYSNVWDREGHNFVADHKIGLVAGGFLSIPIWPVLGFQPEILVSQKGFEGTGSMFDTNYYVNRTTTYLDFPLQLQLRIIPFITLVGGPQYSFLLHERNEYRYGTTSTVQQQEFENDNIRRNILGAVVGADLNLSFLVISGRAGWDLQSNHGDGSSSTPRYKNQWLQLTAGFRF